MVKIIHALSWLNFSNTFKKLDSEAIVVLNSQTRLWKPMYRKWNSTWVFSSQNPSKNGVVERRNRTLKDSAHTIIDSGTLQIFWTEADNTACYNQNRMMINKIATKTLYEIWNESKPNFLISIFFGCKWYIHNNGKNNFTAFGL